MSDISKNQLLEALRYVLRHEINYETERFAWVTEKSIFIQNVLLEKLVLAFLRRESPNVFYKNYYLYDYELLSKRLIITPYTKNSTILIQEIATETIWNKTELPPVKWKLHYLDRMHFSRMLSHYKNYERYHSIFEYSPQTAVLLPKLSKPVSHPVESLLFDTPHVALTIYHDMEEIEHIQKSRSISK